MTAQLVWLPYGFATEHGWHREVQLRCIRGEDEDFLYNASNYQSPIEQLTALITRCVLRLGPWNPPGIDQVRGLVAGDLVALTLHLRRLTFGDRMDCILSCPACSELMDLELSASELLLPSYGIEASTHLVVIEMAGEEKTYHLRLPNGRDLEKAAIHADFDLHEAVADLIQACTISSEGMEAVEPSPDLEQALAERLADLDPQSDLLINLTCSGCHEGAIVPFDPFGFLLQELSGEVERLYKEVHTLALYYHWSEKEILKLPREKRRMYLRLLTDTWTQVGSAA